MLANIRPYAQGLNAWVNSNLEDESRLLRGKSLQDARAWAEDKGLSDLERRFLDASQELEKQDIEIASGGEDGIIKIWQVSNGNLLHSLYGHKSAVRNVSFINNHILASASAGLEKTIILWDLNNMKLDKLLEKGCKLVNDYLKNNPNIKKEDRYICEKNL